MSYDKKFLLQESRSFASPSQKTQIRLRPSSYFTPAEAFLIHTSCYGLLQEFAGSEIRPYHAFKLCQAIQPDQGRGFGRGRGIKHLGAYALLPRKKNLMLTKLLLDCSHPSMIISPKKALLQSEDIMLRLQPDTVKHKLPFLLRLPPEVLILILQHLLPSDLIRFFNSSKQALSYTNLFCRLNPFYFYRCSIDTSNVIEDKRTLMVALLSWARYSELDARWEIVSRLSNLAELLSLVSTSRPTVSTLNPRAPLQFVNHQFGLHENVFDLPDQARLIEVCSTAIAGKHYVCGVGFGTTKTQSFFGNRTKWCHKFENSSATTETIGFAIDKLGIRSIKYGSSPWSFDDPETIGCWEGLSIRKGYSKIRIVRDVGTSMIYCCIASSIAH